MANSCYQELVSSGRYLAHRLIWLWEGETDYIKDTNGLTTTWPLLTRWGRMMHIGVSKFTIMDSDNGLWPGRRQAIVGTNVEYC